MTTRSASKKSKRERGAVAIVVAMSATMIFALCALGVDLGSAFARKRDIQTQADLATLAAAAQLPLSTASQPLIEQAANTYSSKNLVAGQSAGLWNFSDADRTNGFIEYVGKNKLRLFAPHSTVDFWLAPVAGLPDGMKVSAVAAAEIRSPGRGLPFFVSHTCGWGEQTILDDSKGAPVPPGYTPTLTPTTSPAASVQVDTISPTSIDNGTSAATLTLDFSNLQGGEIKKVGFTRESPATHVEASTFTIDKSKLTVSVPSSVLTAADSRWWVRLESEENDKSNKVLRWSASSNAKNLDIGSPGGPPPGSCDSKASGNFGSLRLSRSDVVNGFWLEENMALGVQHDFAQFPPPQPQPCKGAAGAVTDPGTPTAGVNLNCLETETGFFGPTATDAFLTGTTKKTPGRLAKQNTLTSPPACSTQRTISGLSNLKINDDRLSCFLPDGVTVGDVTKQGVLTTPAKNSIKPEIFSSPRFFWIPVLTVDPSKGGSSSYAIIDFRAVFLTGQPDSATGPAHPVNAENGVFMDSSGKKIEKLKVRAINPMALPEFTVDLGPDNTIAYIGTGPKIVRLVE